jgi:hypothetical protein
MKWWTVAGWFWAVTFAAFYASTQLSAQAPGNAFDPYAWITTALLACASTFFFIAALATSVSPPIRSMLVSRRQALPRLGLIDHEVRVDDAERDFVQVINEITVRKRDFFDELPKHFERFDGSSSARQRQTDLAEIALYFDDFSTFLETSSPRVRRHAETFMATMAELMNYQRSDPTSIQVLDIQIQRMHEFTMHIFPAYIKMIRNDQLIFAGLTSLNNRATEQFSTATDRLQRAFEGLILAVEAADAFTRPLIPRLERKRTSALLSQQLKSLRGRLRKH